MSSTEVKHAQRGKWQCNVLNCGEGHCIHIPTDEPCPLCGYELILVKTNGVVFCSNSTNNMDSGCGYERDAK